jgi:hypothetical protein
MIEKRHQRAGVFKTLTFKGIDHRGCDVFEAVFTQGQVEYRIPPLDANGKVWSIGVREVP